MTRERRTSREQKRKRPPTPHEIRGWRFERWPGGEVHFWRKVGDVTTAEHVVSAEEWDELVEAMGRDR